MDGTVTSGVAQPSRDPAALEALRRHDTLFTEQEGIVARLERLADRVSGDSDRPQSPTATAQPPETPPVAYYGLCGFINRTADQRSDLNARTYAALTRLEEIL
jgi:hypothetical protein